MSAATPSEDLRFRVESWTKLEDFFAAYEESRRRRGFGQDLFRVTPQQRADALKVIGGLNGCGGWRRAGADPPEAVWLRHLAPLLAETAKAADALREAAGRGLPGTFEPAPSAWVPPIPPPPTTTAGGGGAAVTPPPLKLERRGFSGGIVVALAALALAIIVAAARKDTPNGGKEGASAEWQFGGSTKDQPDVAMPASPTAQSAFAIVWADANQMANGVTPRALAEFEASRSRTGLTAEAFLVSMLRRLPSDPDSLGPSPAWASVREWAIAAASLRFGLREAEVARAALSANLAFRPIAEPPSTKPSPTPWPAWPRWLTFAPLLAFAALGVRRLPRDLRAGLRAAEDQERGAPITLTVAPEKPALVGSTRDLARRLGSRRPVKGRRLDAVRSIDATLANHGLLTPVVRPASRAIEYLFLIARRHPRDHERDRVLRLLDLLRAGGAPVEAFDYDPDPRRLWPIIRGGRSERVRGDALDLRALAETYPFANLVLVTDGEDLVEFLTRRPREFVGAQLARWPRKMLLTPVPRAEWGERELRISEKLGGLVGRATAEGLEDLVTGLRPVEAKSLHAQALDHARPSQGGAASAAESWADFLHEKLAFDFMPARPPLLALDDPRWLSEVAPGETQRRELLRALRGWLGAHGVYWFGACAAFPQLRFEVTLHLGQTLTRGAVEGAPIVFDERLLARLTLLPWFRVGRMPQWLRREAFDALTPAQRAAARAAVAKLLAKPPAGGIDIETGLPVRSGGETMIDRVMADTMLADSADELVPPTDVPALEEIRRAAQRQAWLRYAARLALAGAWGFGAFWFWPPPDRGPQPLGSWWPLAAYFGATVLGAAYAFRFEVLDGWRRVGRGG